MTRSAGLVVLVMISCLSRLDAQTLPVADSQPTFRAGVNLVSIAVRVTDKKDNEISGLAADRFSLFENGVRQKISFFAAEQEPVSLGILLDVSGSMASSGKLDDAKAALSRLIGTMRPEDEMFFLRFHRQVDKIVDFTSDPKPILQAIGKTGATQDGTALYDAVATALCYMRSAHRHKRALLVVTDGADQHSHRSLEDLIPIVQASQAQVFVIGYFDKEEYELYRSSRHERITLVTSQEIDNPVTVFKRLASDSGAESFFPSTAAKLQEAVDAVAHELRTQYTLAYYPQSGGGDFRRIEVKVAKSGARVRSRRGFGGMEEAAVQSPTGQSVACEQQTLKPYPYESRVASKNGCTVYRDDFSSAATGWPNKDRYHYVTGGYEIVSKKQQVSLGTVNPYALSGGVSMGAAEPAAGVLAANGPWFGDMNASISMELQSTGGAEDLAAAGGLVFHLNDRGYYAVILGRKAPGSREIAFKLIKKYHADSNARDLLPWTDLPLSNLNPGQRKTIAVQCRGVTITVLVQGRPAGKFDDHDFLEGLTGMILYGTGRAVFRDLLVEEACARPL